MIYPSSGNLGSTAGKGVCVGAIVVVGKLGSKVGKGVRVRKLSGVYAGKRGKVLTSDVGVGDSTIGVNVAFGRVIGVTGPQAASNTSAIIRTEKRQRKTRRGLSADFITDSRMVADFGLGKTLPQIILRLMGAKFSKV
jgi:hypothetical protein